MGERMQEKLQLLFQIFSAEIGGRSCTAEVYERCLDNLPLLFMLSNKHDLSHLLGDALWKNGYLTDNKNKAVAQARQSVAAALQRYEAQKKAYDGLAKCFSDKGLPYIPLKGSVIRKYYPEPWMRTCTDIDIYVSEEDIEKADECLISCGYKQTGRSTHDISYYSPNGVHIELHYTMFEKVYFDDDADIPDIHDFSFPSPSGGSMYELSDDMIYFYHITHMVKHFFHGGCGIRPFIDLWLMNHKTDFDEEKRRKLLERGKLLKFAALSEVWFGGGEPTEFTDMLEKYILSGGVYGNTENMVAIQQGQKGGKLSYIIHRLYHALRAVQQPLPCSASSQMADACNGGAPFCKNGN